MLLFNSTLWLFQNTNATLSTNQMQSWNQSWLYCTPFSCTLGSLLSFAMNSQLLCKVTFLSSGWSVITLGLVLCHSIKKLSLTQPAYLSPQTQLYNPASYTCTQCAHCWFNPLIFKISLVILLTVCQMILIMLVWRIWYQIN